ncbi:type II toxin-antitoxin system VapC family toxin [Leptolyngbya sp. 7M]|uniref:type II toxin-antitoxin system VapC family toxin n=1 Tax=Leptolyngbya sp. 7M TaxID=2812896 RepID=UPI001B8D46F9|nr:hypothetical protein [Leptolyngbya sp. 7M]QYO68273.1 hypothetical protein JVX88_16800 [Leptolyngbya sp. 7M]
MKPRSFFVDTWGWVAYGHRRDTYHEAVVKVFQNLRSSNIPIHTSDYVLDEVITLLFKREVFTEARRFLEGIFAAELGQVQIHRITSDYFVDA